METSHLNTLNQNVFIRVDDFRPQSFWFTFDGPACAQVMPVLINIRESEYPKFDVIPETFNNPDTFSLLQT